MTLLRMGALWMFVQAFAVLPNQRSMWRRRQVGASLTPGMHRGRYVGECGERRHGSDQFTTRRFLCATGNMIPYPIRTMPFGSGTVPESVSPAPLPEAANA